MMSPRLRRRSMLLAGALAATPCACNLAFGVDDLRYGATVDATVAGQGGTAGGTNVGATGAGASSAGGADGGSAAGAGGAGQGGGAAGSGATVATGGSGGSTLPAVCGNHAVEDDEQCDDGNTQSNDGCSSSCLMECPAGSVMRVATFHCYLPSAVSDNWNDASSACQNVGAHLVTFRDETEYDFVQSNLPGWDPAYYWIGARDWGNGYEWVTGEPFAFESWHPAEPDPNMCAFSGLATDEWFTAACAGNNNYWVCELEPAGW